MGKIYLTILFICILTLSSDSIEKVQIARTFDIQKNIVKLVSANLYEDFLSQEILCIYGIKSDEHEIYFQLGLFCSLIAGIDGVDLVWDNALYFNMKRESGELLFVENISGKPPIGKIIHRNAEENVNYRTSSLEIPTPINEDPFETTVNYVDLTTRDSSGKLVGGTVRWDTRSSDGHDFFSHITLHVWDAETGKQRINIPFPYYSKFNNAPSTKIQFSPKDRFLIACTLYGSKSYQDKFIICYPASALLDVNSGTILPANRDVAFTSDERYYCTHRDGAPSLVDAQTHDVLLQYKTGVPMTACCFTTDNQKLYIACEDLNIYEFDSHVPQSSVRDWEIYGKN